MCIWPPDSGCDARRKATARGSNGSTDAGATPASTPPAAVTPRKRSGPPVLRRIDTSPVGFALFDPVLLTVHPADCAVRDALHSLQGNRTNGIMRTLTTLTAVFLPLNLIAAIFGMNFEFIPLIHRQGGFWWAMGAMAAIALALLFWRKRYLARTGHR